MFLLRCLGLQMFFCCNFSKIAVVYTFFLLLTTTGGSGDENKQLTVLMEPLPKYLVRNSEVDDPLPTKT